MKRFGYVLLLFSLSFMVYAQNKGEILMKLGDKEITAEEFEYMYTKNLDLVQDPQQKDIDYYKDLFINYKLQLVDAEAKDYHKSWSFKSEFNRYRRELAEKYLSDPAIKDRLLKEAYERMKKDVKVAHIMTMLSRSATPQDTLKAYNKIQKIYKQLQKGLPFEQVALKYSEDPSVKENKGHLGWINVFHTVYPFETVAYETPAGSYSKPFRTKYGYHIVWKEAERPAVYRIQVAQIVVLKGNDPEAAKQKIESIYEQLIRGEDSFENLAKRFSEDKVTAPKGGLMAPFGLREKVEAFESQAFALKNPGDYSRPFQTHNAWHIIKLVKKYPVPSFKDIKPELEKKIARDDRSKLGRRKLLEKLRREFPIEMKGSLKPVYAIIDRNFFNRQWNYPKDFKKANDVLFIINKVYPVTYRDFINFLYRRQTNDPEAYKRKKSVIDRLFEEFTDDQLLKYYETHLEEFYPEFARTVKEYYEGLLLFNYKTKEIWEKALQDTLGLQKFYETNKHKYVQKDKARFVFIQTSDKKSANKLYKALKKRKSLKKIMQIAGTKAVVDVKILDKNKAFEQLDGKLYLKQKQDNKYIVKGITDIIPEHVPGLDTIRGKVMSDYQTYLEKQLLDNLKKKYPVTINEQAWNRIRAKYKN